MNKVLQVCELLAQVVTFDNLTSASLIMLYLKGHFLIETR